jgi:hypothetical protein
MRLVRPRRLALQRLLLRPVRLKPLLRLVRPGRRIPFRPAMRSH